MSNSVDQNLRMAKRNSQLNRKIMPDAPEEIEARRSRKSSNVIFAGDPPSPKKRMSAFSAIA